jgi:hypothetical protein
VSTITFSPASISTFGRPVPSLNAPLPAPEKKPFTSHARSGIPRDRRLEHAWPTRASWLAAAERSPLRQEHLKRAVKLEYREIGKLVDTGALE